MNLASHAGADLGFTYWHSGKAFALELGCSERAVKSATATLRRAGLIEVEESGQGKRRASTYHLLGAETGWQVHDAPHMDRLVNVAFPELREVPTSAPISAPASRYKGKLASRYKGKPASPLTKNKNQERNVSRAHKGESADTLLNTDHDLVSPSPTLIAPVEVAKSRYLDPAQPTQKLRPPPPLRPGEIRTRSGSEQLPGYGPDAEEASPEAEAADIEQLSDGLGFAFPGQTAIAEAVNDYGFKCVMHSLKAAATHGAPNWAWARQRMEAHRTEGCDTNNMTKAQKIAAGVPEHDRFGRGPEWTT